MDETEFLGILKITFILLLREDRTEDKFVRCRKSLNEELGRVFHLDIVI